MTFPKHGGYLYGLFSFDTQYQCEFMSKTYVYKRTAAIIEVTNQKLLPQWLHCGFKVTVNLIDLELITMHNT